MSSLSLDRDAGELDADLHEVDRTVAEVVTLMRRLEAGGHLAEMSQAALGELVVLAVKTLAEKRRVGGHLETTFKSVDTELTATEVAIAVDALLDAADLELFEVAMWKTLGRP